MAAAGQVCPKTIHRCLPVVPELDSPMVLPPSFPRRHLPQIEVVYASHNGNVAVVKCGLTSGVMQRRVADGSGTSVRRWKADLVLGRRELMSCAEGASGGDDRG